MQSVIWLLYFITDVYGHLALKEASRGETLRQIILSPWAISAGLAWMIAGATWVLLLSKNPLITANTVSAFTYVLITFAACLFFNEVLTPTRLLGVVLVCAGIYLVHR
jgi:drug/metabolite transporter (DMT)-like permease